MQWEGGGFHETWELSKPPHCSFLPFTHSLLLRFLPTVSWNIDSFGHTTGNSGVVLGLNYSSQLLNRVSYDLKSLIRRHTRHSFEYVPELLSQKFHYSPVSTESSMSLTTSVLPFHYSSPDSTDQHLRSPHLSNSKRDQIQSSLLHSLTSQLGDCVEVGSRDCDLIILLGNDMTYAGYALTAYRNLDSVINSMNDQSTLTRSPSLRGLIDRNKFTLEVLYSTPQRYFGTKKSQIQSKEVGKGHFVPYSDSLLNDWTGFYGSRPVLKEKIRYPPSSPLL
jgi:hypothetical protein